MLLLPSFSTLFSKLARKVSTAEKTPIMVIMPMVIPSSESNVRVLFSRSAENAKPKLSPISLKKSIYRYDYQTDHKLQFLGEISRQTRTPICIVKKNEKKTQLQ